MRSKISPSISCKSSSQHFLYNTLYNILKYQKAWCETVFETTYSRENVFFLFQHFFLNLRKQFSPKPWKIKVSTIVKLFYGMPIRKWQGQKSWGQILKHFFSLKSHWIQCQCYFIEDSITDPLHEQGPWHFYCKLFSD